MLEKSLILSSKILTTTKKSFLVFGGSGRVGGSCVRSLLNLNKDHDVTIAGRSNDNYNNILKRINRKQNEVKFINCDINDEILVRDILNKKKYDCIINTAGPFQGLDEPNLMKICLELSQNYIDVCDDIKLSRIARSNKYQTLAKSTTSRACISSGIWPGVSSLLAQDLIEKYAKGKDNVEEVKFDFFTAGSGGAGETILTATFLLLGENVLTYKDGKEVYKKPASDLKLVSFGNIIKEREVVRLNLIECESCHKSSGIKNVSTFFGTSPVIWNKLFIYMARIIPQKLLQNRNAMKLLAAISLPMVRLVDLFVKSRNSIRIELKLKNNTNIVGILSHEDLELAVGESLASFAIEFSQNDIKPGVYFPEEIDNSNFRKNILDYIINNGNGNGVIEYSVKIEE